MLKKLDAYNDIELNVFDNSAQNLGDVRVSTNTQFSSDRLSITVDDDKPDYSVKFYHKTIDNSKIKRASVYLKNTKTGTMYGGTSSVGKVDGRDDLIVSGVKFGQSYPSGTYEVYSVKYETTDGLLITYYNENYSIKDKNNTNAKFTCKVNNVIDFTNKINPDAVTKTNVKLLYKGLTSTKSLTVKTSAKEESDRKVTFRIGIGSSGAKLDNVKVVFRSENGNNQIVTDLVNEGVVTSNGFSYNASMIIPENQPAGTYSLYSMELVSDRGVTTKYVQKDNLKIIVKANDRIVVDEIGTTPKNTKVEKTNGVAKATVELPKETVSEEVLANTDEAGKEFAAESYEFAVESSVIPENTTVEIGKVITGGIYDNVKEIAKSNDNLKNADTYRVFEINLVDNNNTKVDNNVITNGKVAITTTVPDGFDASKTAVYRVGDDGTTLIECKTIPAGDGKVTFETNHFSTYVFALKSANNKPVIKPTPNPINPSDPDDIYDPDDIQDPDDIIQPGGGNKIVASENNTATSGNGTTDASANTGKAPNTGDRAPIAALLFVMVSACMTVIGSIVKRKRV